MKIIIFAGGTGKRFWPLSRKHSPKQFMPVIDNKPLIQLKYDYLRLGFEPKDIFLSTGIQYKSEVETILPEIPKQNFIFEPFMRDTGPAVAYAISYVHKLYPDEVISTQWSDHYIKKPSIFVEALKEAEKIVTDEDRTVVVGVPARFASPHRGYIKFGKKLKGLDGGNNIVLCEFLRFVEKPTAEVAKEYIASGDYAWNPGYFVSTYEKFMEKYRSFTPDMYETIQKIVSDTGNSQLQEQYAGLKKIAFDYIFAENLNQNEAYVINVDMGWSDVGELIAYKETLEVEPNGNVVQGRSVDLGSRDCLIINKSDKELVATINLEGLIIINTDDVVAIFPKEDNGTVKKLLAQLEEDGMEEYL